MTHQENITDNPGWVTRASFNIASKAKVKDASKAECSIDSAKVHIDRIDRPRFTAKSHGDPDICTTSCWMDSLRKDSLSKTAIAHGMPKTLASASRFLVHLVQQPRWLVPEQRDLQ